MVATVCRIWVSTKSEKTSERAYFTIHCFRWYFSWKFFWEQL